MLIFEIALGIILAPLLVMAFAYLIGGTVVGIGALSRTRAGVFWVAFAIVVIYAVKAWIQHGFF